MSDVSTWDTTAANNNSASPDGFPEGMAPAGVNDSSREVMAAVARYRDEVDLRNAVNNVQFATTNGVPPMGYMGNFATLGWLGSTYNNNILFTPYVTPLTGVYDGMRIKVTSGGTGATIRMGIYSQGSDGLPDALLTETGDIDGGTTGWQEAALGTEVTLKANTLYFGAYAFKNIASQINIVNGLVIGSIFNIPVFGIDPITDTINRYAYQSIGAWSSLPNPQSGSLTYAAGSANYFTILPVLKA